MAEYLAKSEDLSAVADAIRAKGGTYAQLTFPGGMVEAINAIKTGSGATDVTDSIVSVAFSSTSASGAYDGFGGILPEDSKIAIFLWQGDKSNAVNNQCLFAVLQRVYINTNDASVGPMMYCRWKNSSFDFKLNYAPTYDLIVNSGDAFRMVVIK